MHVLVGCQIRLLREEQVKALVLKVREVDAAIQEGLLAGTLLNTHALAAPSASTTLAGVPVLSISHSRKGGVWLCASIWRSMLIKSAHLQSNLSPQSDTHMSMFARMRTNLSASIACGQLSAQP